jgi:hypothetical protein
MSDCLGQCSIAISSREFWPINSSIYTIIGRFLCLSCPFYWVTLSMMQPSFVLLKLDLKSIYVFISKVNMHVVG